MTVDLYGIEAFPRYVLISQDGKVHYFGRKGVEAEICELLYGDRKILRSQDTTEAQIDRQLRLVWIAGVGVLLLAVTWLALRMRRQVRVCPKSS